MKKFPLDCPRDCPYLHSWDMSIDDWTNICDLLKMQIDDCDMNFMFLPICPLEGKKLPIPHCLVGTNGYNMHPAICEALKGVYNYPEPKKTFGYNWFREDLDRWNPDEIVIFGLCTDICVVSNALILRAAYPDIPIKCLAYCCAGTTSDAHEAALKVMESCQIEVI